MKFMKHNGKCVAVIKKIKNNREKAETIASPVNQSVLTAG